MPKKKLDELIRWKCTPQPFCMDLIPVTVWQHHIWPFFPSAAALWTLCTVNTYMLGWAYRALRGCLRFEPWDALYIYWHSRRLWLSLGLHMAVNRVPGHWASAPRMLSPLRDIDWKTRLVFSHYIHPMRARGRQISRCLQLLITEGTRVLHTLEMPHCKDLLPWVRQCNADLSALWHQGSLPHTVALFELDIKAMFPSLDRQDVWDSICEIAHLVSRAPGPTGRPRRGTLRFAINGIDRKLDRIGSGSPDLFHNIPVDDVLRYVYFDIFYNDAFVFTNQVLRQKRGLAIGGPCSSQLASGKCMLSEHRFYPVYPPFAPVGAPATHPCLLPTKPGRFRDNINGLMFTHTPRDLLQTSFEALYNLDLQWEGGGDQWITL